MLLAPRGPRALAVSSDQGTGALWERAAGFQLQAPGTQSARGAGAVAHKGNPSPRRPAPRKHSPRSADSRDSGTRRDAAQSSLLGVAVVAGPGQTRAEGGGREREGLDCRRKLRARKGHPGAPQRQNWPRGGDPTTLRPEPACWAGPRAWARLQPGPQLDPDRGRPGTPRRGCRATHCPSPTRIFTLPRAKVSFSVREDR